MDIPLKATVFARRAVRITVSFVILIAAFAAIVGWHSLSAVKGSNVPDGNAITQSRQADNATNGSSNGSHTQLNCPVIFEDTLSFNYLCIRRADSVSQVTQIFVADYANNGVVRHDVGADLSGSATSLPMSYGIPWFAGDLDRDGEFELVVQRGEFGFPATGYLDFYNSADWSLRQRFAFSQQNGLMHPFVFNLDQDPYLEMFATPNNGSGASSQAIIIDYDPSADTFVIVSSIWPPYGGGNPAVADFDDDGRFEFIIGSLDGYSLLEWQDSNLVYISLLDSSSGNNNGAVACRPFPDGKTYALLGHSGARYTYDLLKATGDNTFTIVHQFEENTGATGYSQCSAADVDCDGLDELQMTIIPQYEVWDWDTVSGQFIQVCVWEFETYGTILNWYAADFNQNGADEWCSIGNAFIFRCFLDPRCVNCDSSGTCPPAAVPCSCPCHADPSCDSIVVDIRDVVDVIGVAFRGNQPQGQSSCPFADTDTDCTGSTNVIDVVKTVDVAFRGADPAIVFCTPCQ